MLFKRRACTSEQKKSDGKEKGCKIMARKRLGGKEINKMQLKLPALSANEGMARAAVAAFCSQLDPLAVELADVKCAVSEAVTNCIVHAYKNEGGWIYINVYLLEGRVAKIEIKDKGCGIENVDQAMAPFYTTDKQGERSGMGFAIMQGLSQKLRVKSEPQKGTTLDIYIKLGK